MVPGMTANYALKEEIRDYWSKRAESFDSFFGHRIPPGPEREAWQAAMRRHLGEAPLEVLELACGTGEVTGALRGLGHRVTGIDFSEAMLARAKAKHAGDAGARFFLADAEHTREPEGRYDAVVCRHLVWTLTDPEAALADWFRVLKPGGQMLIFDGDYVTPNGFAGRFARRALAWLDRWEGVTPAPGQDAQRHAAIMRDLPFGDGLTPERLVPMVARAGFEAIAVLPHTPIARAQRQGASLRNRLKTMLYRRFILHARKG